MDDLKKINALLQGLKRVKSELIRRNKLSDKVRDRGNCTFKKVQKLNADLNWQCMDYDKSKTDFARMYNNSVFDVGVDVKFYNPSPFHSYKH